MGQITDPIEELVFLGEMIGNLGFGFRATNSNTAGLTNAKP